ncbi:MAG: hemerythrin domain-containing protein [Sciscionella sp.]
MSNKNEHRDLISLIIADHRAVESVFQELERGEASPQRRRELVDHVVAELVRHSVAEEQYMYPAARKALQDGDTMVDHEIAEHSEAEQVMKDLEGVDPHDKKFDTLVGQLIADVRHHVEDEEKDLLPRLQKTCTAEELRELGDNVRRAKEMAPTRPHPGAPDTPPANRILDVGAGFVDRIRDAWAKTAR